MAIKAGQILHSGHGFVIDRIQTGGVSNLNIPENKIFELGNFSSVSTVRDIPQLTFDLESTDVSTEVEALLHGKSPLLTANNEEFDFSRSMPLDIISPFKSAQGAYDVVKGIVVPYLTLDSVTYRFGVGQNATQSFTLQGDSVYFIPGTPVWQEFTLTAGANIPYTLANIAIEYVESGDSLYVLSACLKNPSTGASLRLFIGDDYTNTTTSVTVIQSAVANGYTKLHVTYGTAAAATYPVSVHQGTSVKPAAVRAKDVCVYVGNGAATPVLTRWAGVQNVEVTRKVTLENNEEFCNSKYVSIDYDVPDVTGTIGVKSVNPSDLWTKIAQVANVATNKIAGPYSSIPVEIQILINDPDTGVTLKSIDVPDARFLLPAVQGRVQTKLETSFRFTSDAGEMSVFKGTPV